ncbi:UNVERIFIED_CONTAM: hypothetical protein Slati_0436800 [Sesamum latifolium]|uniref:Uncharacterized protein n=1 Tax=Sesamum latifolium TaxID=2727402 RepID=A0AAW2Y043_9LAMI
MGKVGSKFKLCTAMLGSTSTRSRADHAKTSTFSCKTVVNCPASAGFSWELILVILSHTLASCDKLRQLPGKRLKAGHPRIMLYADGMSTTRK